MVTGTSPAPLVDSTPTCDTGVRKELTGGPSAASLDSFYYKAAKPRFQGDRYHPVEFRDFVSDRLSAAVQVTGVGPEGYIYLANIPCTYRWTPGTRRKNLAVIYSFCDIASDLGYDASEVSFLTLTVRHPKRLTYPAARAALQALREGWKKLSRELRRDHVEYLAVIEPGEKNGFPHYHVVMLGASEALCERYIAFWCGRVDALPQGQDYSTVRDIRKTGAYIAKYLSKTLDSELDLKWLELCYRERVRTWAMTRDMRSKIAAKYANPLKGLGLCGDTQMDWGDDRAVW